jgi:hypothetical protein
MVNFSSNKIKGSQEKADFMGSGKINFFLIIKGKL